MVAGEIALPMLGTARFAYRVGGVSVETELDGAMCADCGAVVFHARNPERIGRAHRSLKRSQAR